MCESCLEHHVGWFNALIPDDPDIKLSFSFSFLSPFFYLFIFISFYFFNYDI